MCYEGWQKFLFILPFLLFPIKGSETVTRCHGLKMPAADGKMRVTGMADTETMFRIMLKSIPTIYESNKI